MSEQLKLKNGFRNALFQYVLIGLLSVGMLSLQGCFSGGGDEVAGATGNSGTVGTGSTGGTGSSGPDIGASSDAKMVLLTESLQLPSGESGSVRITANLKDANNNLMTGEPVTFSATSGSLQVLKNNQGQSATDNLGNAVAVLSSPNNPIPRSITVTATGGGSSASINIDVTGTKLEVSGPANAIAFGQSASLTVKLKAGDGSVLQNKELTVTSEKGNALSATKITTNVQGEASVTVTDSQGVNDKITVSALNGSVSQDFALKVSADSIKFNVPDSNAEIPLGTQQNVEVELRKNGQPVAGKDVNFSITRGSLVNTPATTNASGIATVTVQSDNAGGATITASTDKEEATLGVEFIATTPAAINLEAAPKRVSLGQTSTLTATVKDATQNLVKNKKVLFNLSDITGGSLSKGEVITNSLGQASSVYTAGSQASGEGQVKITAKVNGTAISKEAALTVDPQNVRIIFGTGNEMFEPNSAQYRIPYVIQVSDDGGPVAGVDVDVSVFPTEYYKGAYVGFDSDGDQKPDKWVANQTVTCSAEDTDRNGIINDGETDFNGDGSATPPAVVSVGPSPGQSPTVSNSTVTTDANGFGYFSLYYPQEFANWVKVELVAQTTQAGRESSFSLRTIPIAIASDVNDIKISPPAPNGSPFGLGVAPNNNCGNTL